MSDECKVVFRVRVAWWLRPYLHALAFFAALTGCMPDQGKLARVVDRAIRIELGR